MLNMRCGHDGWGVPAAALQVLGQEELLQVPCVSHCQRCCLRLLHGVPHHRAGQRGVCPNPKR